MVPDLSGRRRISPERTLSGKNEYTISAITEGLEMMLSSGALEIDELEVRRSRTCGC